VVADSGPSSSSVWGSKCPVQRSPEELAHDGATWNSSPPLGLVVAMDEHDELHPAIAL